jgi:hypothetical protein
MTRREAWWVHLASFLVGGTGLVYAWMLYLMEPADAFAVVHHPWQPAVQHLHVWAAPMLVFAAGLIWHNHIWMHWRRGVRRRRTSGVALLLTLVPMIASGYLIQTAVSSGWRSVWVGVHLAASALWLGGYLVHFLQPVLSRRRARRGRPGDARRRLGPVLSAPRRRPGDLPEV